jgi:hypothetical protein
MLKLAKNKRNKNPKTKLKKMPNIRDLFENLKLSFI